MTLYNSRFLLLLVGVFLAIGLTAQQPNGFNNILLDQNWRFHRGGAIAAEKPEFDDSNWRTVSIPHDWSIEDLPNAQSPFHQNAISQVNTGFATGGTGWYRNTFSVPIALKGKQVSLTFEGVYMNSTIWLNGYLVGSNKYGYSEFTIDLSNRINFGSNNILVVKVANEGENSRWYSGSGIYRHVWLNIRNPIHFKQLGTFITTPNINEQFCKTSISTNLVNEYNSNAYIKLVSIVIDKNRNEVGRAIHSDSLLLVAGMPIQQNIVLNNYKSWSTDSPYLYRLISKLYFENMLVDSVETVFGIRSLKFSSEGFFLNHQSIKLKGGCLHHDNGPLGAKAYDRAEVRKVELLKLAGFNAVRTSHNPPSIAFLNACDSLGMLVIDEAFDCWADGKNDFDYHLYFQKNWQKDIEAMVLRDRNHPSIIMWSNGNEIPNKQKESVIRVSSMINQFIKTLDTTRPTTSGVNELLPSTDGFFNTLDISGYNYAAGGDHLNSDVYAADHERVPNRLMYESEAYPLEAFDSWMKVKKYPFVFGAFVWTAFDYIGEGGIGWHGYWPDKFSYPFTLAYCGDIDICGNKRPSSFYRDALWKENQLSIFVTAPSPSFRQNPKREDWSKWHWYDVLADWNWSELQNKKLNVVVYSSCEEVELFLNGKSLGRKNTNQSTKFMQNWVVPYSNGKLTAIGYSNHKQVNTSSLTTASSAYKICATVDKIELKANGQDLSYITLSIKDKQGNLHPKAKNLIKFKLIGEGEIVGVGNGNPTSLESYQKLQRTAWQGKCIVIVKSTQKTGKIVLEATSNGLVSARTTLFSK